MIIKSTNESWRKQMRLTDFRTLIANMPVLYQAFPSKRATWASHIERCDAAGNALCSIFDSLDEVTVSRNDLRNLAEKQDLAQFVMATIIWGYPGGMRGKNVENLIGHFDQLTQLLTEARSQPVADWNKHYLNVGPIKGIGLSSYTKFLSFLSVQVHGYIALILDDRIIRVANGGLFEELAPLRSLRNHNSAQLYPTYLQCMHDIAPRLSVTAEQLEFFLFEFGLNLKQLHA